MGFEDLVGMISDFVGDVSEGIQDIAVDIGEFSKDAIEQLGSEVKEAMEKGDIEGAIACSDMSEENKELANKITDSFNTDCKQLFVSGAKIVAGALGTAAALATPGFQPAGLAAAASLVSGVKDFASQLGSKNASELANA